VKVAVKSREFAVLPNDESERKRREGAMRSL